MSRDSAELRPQLAEATESLDGAVKEVCAMDPTKANTGELIQIDELRSAVIWTKGVSSYTPDYYVELLPTSPWIHQPFEEYDGLRPQGLAKKYEI